MEAMRSRDSAEFISEFGSSVPLVHASMSFIDCSPCPGNITDWLIDIQSWQSALRRLSTCRRRRGNGAATLSRCSTPLALLSMLRIFLRKGIRGTIPVWLLLPVVTEVVVFKGVWGYVLKESCVLNGHTCKLIRIRLRKYPVHIGCIF